MPRNFKDWLTAYVEYASFSEAPRRMHFWSGVSAIAGALRRQVWIDQAYFRWYCNFYVIIVAPPGIVSKSTTAGIAMDLLRRVPGVKFGPDVVTWQALVKAFAEANEQFKYVNGSGEDEWHTMCAFTIESSEFGNLLNPSDREMVDLLVTLWDGKQGAFKKITKMSGSDIVENPWINLIACTTPAWIAGNFPEYIIGGGFTSRCLFVYAETKDKFVAYPGLVVPSDLYQKQLALIQDLEHISISLVGPYKLSQEAVKWGTEWYEYHYKHRPEQLDDERFGGYIARKQTHIHKLAIVLAASQRDERVITAEDLSLANTMVTDLEQDMPKVFAKIGRTEASVQVERFIQFIIKSGRVPYTEAYRYIHTHFPDAKDFEGVLAGAIRAGYVTMVSTEKGMFIEAAKK